MNLNVMSYLFSCIPNPLNVSLPKTPFYDSQETENTIIIEAEHHHEHSHHENNREDNFDQKHEDQQHDEHHHHDHHDHHDSERIPHQ